MSFYIRPIKHSDNPALAQVIRHVSAEFGLTADKGYSVADPTLDSLFEVYNRPQSHYWVLTDASDAVVGGAGIAPLMGRPEVCELQKMYFLSKPRGQGYAKKLLTLCLQTAKEIGYKQCYLESTAELKAALGLYEHMGFTHLEQHWGNTGHSDCEIVMVKEL
ncbi:GNAT family N-acetyltransferase [Vibrio aphrogenes]|uniref:GNAT family N-acetyltransferase n=1 Tax=Vibrio aphrogenes TaxID=1891186 RepID=UPI000B35B672|nr:GNAT family N-acetyltransferase [Vibrio aphrogenes]